MCMKISNLEIPNSAESGLCASHWIKNLIFFHCFVFLALRRTQTLILCVSRRLPPSLSNLPVGKVADLRVRYHRRRRPLPFFNHRRSELPSVFRKRRRDLNLTLGRRRCFPPVFFANQRLCNFRTSSNTAPLALDRRNRLLCASPGNQICLRSIEVAAKFKVVITT
ncbi:hypothetical protein U1Q18_021896 [Sarracenia purpurea var. burkii]